LGEDVDPAGVPVPGDVHADERVEGTLVDAVISVAYHSPVDVGRDHQDQRAGGRLECFLDVGGVEQPERDVQCLAETAVGVVVDSPSSCSTMNPKTFRGLVAYGS
jgi:hypothetical protein